MRLDLPVRRDLRAHAGEYALAAAMVGVALVALVTRIDVEDADAHLFRHATWWSWALTVAVCATLVGRCRWPLRTLAVGLVLVLPLELGHQRDTVAFFALVIALYSVAANLRPRLALRGVAQIALFYAVLAATGTIVLSSVPMLGPLFLSGAFAFGLVVQRSRTRQQLDAHSATEQAAAAMESAELDAADARLRIAQELHDVVAHSLSVIAVQAGIGAHLIDRQPAEAARALDAIRTTCHTTETELSRLVDILKNGTPTDSSSAPALKAVSALVEQIRSADLPVALITNGDLVTVPPGASLAAYRIVQEALTNVVRHAGRGASATVTIRTTDDRVEVTIEDTGRGTVPHDPGTRSGGNGLLGMSERARMYDGEVHSGPRPGGGFRVRATLNFRSDNRTSDAPARAPTATADDPTARHATRRISTATWDIALAALMAVIATLEVITTNPTATGPHFTPTHLWAFTLRMASCATLAFRRRHPIIAYGVTWGLGLALTIGDYQVGVMVFVLWIGLYTIAAYTTTPHLIVAAIATVAGIGVIAWSKPPDLTAAGAVWAGAFFAASAIAGYTVQREREGRAAALIARQDASAAHVRHARLALTSERLRIADELGTVIARSIDTIARHAESGTQLIATNDTVDPNDTIDTIAARDTLETISTISRDALNDLRRLLKHMRSTTASTTYSPILAPSDAAAFDSVSAPR